MSRPKYVPTDRERLVLEGVVNPRYDRQILNGLDPFINGTAPDRHGRLVQRGRT